MRRLSSTLIVAVVVWAAILWQKSIKIANSPEGTEPMSDELVDHPVRGRRRTPEV